MNPQRKKIYIVIIVVCFVLSAGILYWNFFGGSANQTPPLPNDISQASNALPTEVQTSTSSTGATSFAAPAVFPASNSFNTAVLNSSAFKKLNPYSPVDVSGQLGRPDPFKNY